MSIPDWKLEARQLNKGIHGVDGWIVSAPPKADLMAAVDAGQEVTTRRIAVLESSYYLTNAEAEAYAKLFADALALRSRVEALEGAARDYIQAINLLHDNVLNSAAYEVVAEKRAKLTALLATPANGEQPERKGGE